MSQLHVRGKLGMQVFELFAGLTDHLGHPFTVVVNDGEGDDPTYFNRLDELFEYTIPVNTARGFQKQKAWEPKAIHRMFEARMRGLTLFRLKENHTYTPMDTIIHMRGKDKVVAEVGSYMETATRLATEKPPLWILSDDIKFSGSVATTLELNKSFNKDTKYEVSEQNDIDDWYSCLYADEIWGCMSTFTLSTLLINPEKKIHVFGEKYNTGDYILVKENYEAVNALMEYCPNVQWID